MVKGSRQFSNPFSSKQSKPIYQHNTTILFFDQLSAPKLNLIIPQASFKMQFKSMVLVLACALSVMASPFTLRDTVSSEYVELHRHNASIPGHSIIYYGPSKGTMTGHPASIRVKERASCTYTGDLSCDAQHNDANNEICTNLVNDLGGNAGVGVGTSPRQICYQATGSGSSVAEDHAYCCVSWHDVVPNLNKGDLAPFAEESK
jgi:hypothetical protein